MKCCCRTHHWTPFKCRAASSAPTTTSRQLWTIAERWETAGLRFGRSTPYRGLSYDDLACCCHLPITGCRCMVRSTSSCARWLRATRRHKTCHACCSWLVGDGACICLHAGSLQLPAQRKHATCSKGLVTLEPHLGKHGRCCCNFRRRVHVHAPRSAPIRVNVPRRTDFATCAAEQKPRVRWEIRVCACNWHGHAALQSTASTHPPTQVGLVSLRHSPMSLPRG